MGGHLFVSMGFNFIRLITAMDQHRHVASLIAYGIAEYQLLSLCLSLPVIKKKFFIIPHQVLHTSTYIGTYITYNKRS